MKSDLLKIYARTGGSSAAHHAIAAACFAIARLWIYGMPLQPEAFFAEGGRYLGLLLLSTMAFLKIKSIYKDILTRQNAAQDVPGGLLAQLVVFKFISTALWLTFLFIPLASHDLYSHLLGYFFIFCAISVYASMSATYLPLFCCDVGLQIGFALFIIWINRDIPETPYILGLLLMFSAYALISGFRISRITKSLVESSLALERAAHSAVEANKTKSDFLAMMSHEIRTPMTGILGMVDFLAETDLTPEQNSCVETITDCSKTLLNTLNDILDISKMEAGKLAINNINCDLYNILENSVKVLEKTAAGKKLALRLHIDASVPKYIHCDPHRLRQALMNLINNALKFTHVGYVEVSASFKGGMIRIEVRDTGIGIEPKKIKRLFAAFSQADNSIARQYGGSGLGLSITKRLIEIMDGKIGAASEKGHGSTFWFELPYKEPVPEKEDAVKSAQNTAAAPQRILLVEDNSVNQTICTRLLGKKGHHVTVAGDGDTALNLIRSGSFDIVLMDCSLPGKDGMEVTREIKTMDEKRYAKIPIIALTANAMESYIKQCYDAGMVDHVIKPYEPHELYQAIARHAPHKTAIPPVSIDNLKSVEEEMGPEYMLQLVQSGLAEVERLMQIILESSRQHNLPELRATAHDLKAVSGSISMKQTSTLAESIEKACLTKRIDTLPGLLKQLSLAKQSEEKILRMLSA